jgi:hypothetical protein
LAAAKHFAFRMDTLGQLAGDFTSIVICEQQLDPPELATWEDGMA